jgi:hypothetical protein
VRTETAWRKWISTQLPGKQYAALRRQMRAAFYAGAQWGRATGVLAVAERVELVDTPPKRKRVVRHKRRS